MDDNQDTIRRRIIDRAVSLFAKDRGNSGSDGRTFTTAHYAQSMKAEFRTPGPALDSAACTSHLEAMDDVEAVGSCLWRHTAQRGASADDGTTGTPILDKLSWAEDCVEAILKNVPMFWWTVGTMAAELSGGEMSDVDCDLVENLVGCVLYTLAIDGRVLSQSNVLLGGERCTVFALDAARSDARGSRTERST